jgi:hypothetical protein
VNPHPIPTTLAHRPTVGGLVVPWISIHHGDGRYVLGAVHHTRVEQCFIHRLCQIDGQPLGDTSVFLMRQRDLDRRMSSEPAMHPECAAYSIRACPMLTGAMSHYRSTPHAVDGKPCPDPGCECAGWVPSPDAGRRAGQPAEAYFSVWARDWLPAADEKTHRVTAAVLLGDPLKVRPIPTTPLTASAATAGP